VTVRVMRRTLTLGALLLLLAACATPQADALLADSGGLPLREPCWRMRSAPTWPSLALWRGVAVKSSLVFDGATYA
jgi:hypothetical protein